MNFYINAQGIIYYGDVQPGARLATSEEINNLHHKNRINIKIFELKQKLKGTDYIALKIIEKAASAEDYADVIKKRQPWRTEINELEKELE